MFRDQDESLIEDIRYSIDKMILESIVFDSTKHEALRAFNNARDCLLLNEEFKMLYSDLCALHMNMNLLEETTDSRIVVRVITKALNSDIVQNEIKLKYPEFFL